MLPDHAAIAAHLDGAPTREEGMPFLIPVMDMDHLADLGVVHARKRLAPL